MIVLETYGSRLDRAMDRGFDRDSIEHDKATPEPLSPEWQAALDASIAEARALRQAVAS